MNKGVEILLERMKSNPEEFVPQYDGGTTKWGSVIGHLQAYLDKEDVKALDDAWKETVKQAMQDRFTEAVMKELLDPKSEQFPTSSIGLGGATLGHSTAVNQATNTLNAIGSPYTLTANNGTGQLAWQANTATLTLGQTQIQEQELQHMKAHLEYLKQQAKAQQAKNQTLVGKLYNYLGSNK